MRIGQVRLSRFPQPIPIPRALHISIRLNGDTRKIDMSKRNLVVFFVTVVLTATAAFGQLITTPQITTTEAASKLLVNVNNPDPATTQYVLSLKSNGVDLGTVTSTSPQITTPVLPANTVVTVTVTAKSATSTSLPATTSWSMYPAPPTNIKGLGGKNKISISWTAAPGAASYQLTLSNGMSFVTTALSYTVTGLPNATSFNLIMASLNPSGSRGSFSSTVVVRTANICCD